MVPRVNRRAVIELEIPLPPPEATETECQVCRTEFCAAQHCKRTTTVLHCCSKPLCCHCAVKLAFVCTCAPHCRQVVAHCPFCRQISHVDSVDVFKGLSKKRSCAHCNSSSSRLSSD